MMTAKKLPPVKDWRARKVENWTVATFQAYRTDRHAELFKVPYSPMMSWAIENRHVKRVLDEHGPHVLKRWIDLSFESYKPRPQYLGIDFGFMMKFRSNLLQQAVAEQNKAQKSADDIDERIRKMEALSDDDLDWI